MNINLITYTTNCIILSIIPVIGNQWAARLFCMPQLILLYYINKYRILCLTTSDSINLGHQETKLLTAGLYEHKTIDYPNY